MSTINGGGGGHYISDGDLMAWLATQQSRIYGDLRDEMDLSEARAQFTDKLNGIKSELAQANESKNFSKVDQELQQLMSDYGSDPRFSDACNDLKGMADQIHGGCQSWATYQKDLEKYHADQAKFDAEAKQYELSDPAAYEAMMNSQNRPTPPTPPAEQHYSDGVMDGWKKLLEGKTDTASKNDQLTMIHIQQLKATLDQGSQLASQFISSDDKASNSIIHNIA